MTMQYTATEVRDMASKYGICRECYQPIVSRVDGNDTCEAGHVHPSSESRQLTPDELNLYVDMMVYFVP